MNKIRTILQQKPFVGWIVAGVLALVAVYFATSGSRTKQMYTPDSMTEMLTIRYADTGTEATIPRGRLLRDLLDSNDGKLDPTKGHINPETGKPTGFPFNKELWDGMVAQVNADRERVQNKGRTPAPAPAQPAAPKAK